MGKSGENRRRAKIRERMAEAAKSASPARETPRGAPTLPFTSLGVSAGLEFASQLAGHCAAAAKRDDSPPRGPPRIAS